MNKLLLTAMSVLPAVSILSADFLSSDWKLSKREDHYQLSRGNTTVVLKNAYLSTVKDFYLVQGEIEIEYTMGEVSIARVIYKTFKDCKITLKLVE